MISGTGVDRGGANEALLDVVSLLGCPVITTGAGRSTVSAEHPNFVYGFGGAGDEVRREADVLLVAGSLVTVIVVAYLLLSAIAVQMTADGVFGFLDTYLQR